MIKRLKIKEQRITFNLNDISKSQLDDLASKTVESNSDVVSFFVPDQWKQINIPILSDMPIEIDDAQAKGLRIDFIRYSHLPLNAPIPISLFFPPQNLQNFNPSNVQISPSDSIKVMDSVPLINARLFATGVDSLFLDTVKDMIEVVIIVAERPDRTLLDWSVQFVNPRQLEDRYVTALMSDVSDNDIRLMQPILREEYLRNRFRSYMNHFQLYESEDNKLDFSIFLKDRQIYINKGNALSSSTAVR